MSYFLSPKDAISYLYSATRGPSWARHRWSDAPREGPRPPELHLVIGSLLWGHLGVQHGSDLDRALREWACHGGARTNEVRSIDRKMRKLLREREMLIIKIPRKYRKEPSQGITRFTYEGDDKPSIRLKSDWRYDLDGDE